MLFVVDDNNEVRQRCVKYINTLHGKNSVAIKEYKPKRSFEQNAYYWVILGVISEYTGYDAVDELHPSFKAKFLGMKEVNNIFDNKTFLRPKSTTKLSTKEFGHYLDKVIAYAMMNDIEIPPPRFFGYKI